MNTNEASQDREADRTASFVPEGDVTEGSDRPGSPGRSLDRYRLKRSVDLMPTNTGDVQLLHDGTEEQYEIVRPDPDTLLVLDLLQSDFFSEEEICERLRIRGLRTETVSRSISALERIGVLERDRGRDLLTAKEAERFDRQLIYLADIAPEAQSAWELQARLRDSHVVVLGCGGLGSWAATGLTLAGVGRLTLVDDDIVELSNLNRQLLFRTADLGRAKVTAAKRSLTAIDPDLDVTIVERKVESATDVAELAGEADLLVMTADHPPYEVANVVNRACLSTGTPWISAGQIPPMIRVGPVVVPGQTPCLECQDRVFHRDFPHYEALKRHRKSKPTAAATLGPATGIIGSLIAMEGVHHLTGTVSPATLGRALLMDLRTLQVEFEPIESDPGCECRNPRQGAGIFSIG